ncbi:MAG TPA: glycosyl hydrolase [Mucilaginibacter sp.]|jgi:hypothetical protein
MKKIHSFIFLLLSSFLCWHKADAQASKTDSLKRGFIAPPNSAKPRVWWHWMNGNITKDGIEKDLKWMSRTGIGGFQNFDAALATPQIVKKRLIFMTPEWKDAFHFTAKLADSLHLEMAIAGSPGWSESGGPWVPIKDGMKKLVWSETPVEGGKPYTGKIPAPPSVTGPFQNLIMAPGFGAPPERDEKPQFYKDVSVIAYKLADSDWSLIDLKAKVTSSGGTFDLSQLTDGDLTKTQLLPSDTVKGFAWIQFEFGTPQTIKAVTVVGGGERAQFEPPGEQHPSRTLESSNDGLSFTRVTVIPAGNVSQQTIDIPVTNARFFRIVFKNPTARPGIAAMLGMGGPPPKAPAGTDIAEIVLHTVTRINHFEEKAGFSPVVESGATPNAMSDAIQSRDIIDLSDKLDVNGNLTWTPPAGKWNILRFGYSMLGITNHPASAEATGPEVDKLDPVAIKAYFANYLDQYKSATEGLMGNKGGLQYMVTDSWEAGAQNWTGNLPAEFFKRRGYNMLPWMPVLTGRIINSTEQSEQFLWDFRKTLGELLAEYHYDQLTTILHERGMKRYSESHEAGRALIADGMEVKRTADIPMAAMWTPGLFGDGLNYRADIRESASVAHIYGQNLVAAESLTALGIGGNAWSYSPEKLKPTADMELASGLNRFVIHTSVHQPTDDKIPGLGLGPFGQWFNRHETWAEQAKAWTAYLSRSAYMLQQGKFVADIIYYYGEDDNITHMFGRNLPQIPEGYNFDFVNADALVNVLGVRNGRITTPSGMHYEVLALDSNSRRMTLKVLQKINALVNAGATVIGPKPTGSPSLSDDKAKYDGIVNNLWPSGNGTKATGQGKVIAGLDISAALSEIKIRPDFEYSKPRNNTKLLYVHRELPQEDIYWVNNRSDTVENIEANFRVSGKLVEIWHPESGRTEQASYTFEGGNTRVPLRLEPNDAVFVVFKGHTSIASRVVAAKKETVLASIGGKWDLGFQKDRGAPEKISMEKLDSWTANADNGVKYFSGTATYSKKITASASWLKKGDRLWLDLGDVKNIAEIIVNGKSMGITWKKPFRTDVTGALKPGENTIEIKVTNLWVNRLIGDQQPGVSTKITYTTMPFYNASSPLLPSGLLGPVQLISVR